MNFNDVWGTASVALTTFGLKAIGAVIVWIVGRWLIGFAVRLISGALTRQHVDPTLLRYIGSIVTVALNVILVVALLGYFGVETTSFAALMAAMGIAIGAAWGGLLANFAAGAFLIVLRPFKVGDYVAVGALEGTVTEIGLFATTIDAPDGVQNLIGNNAIFSGTIKNFSHNPFRRVDRLAQLAHGVDVHDAIRRLQEALAKIPNVSTNPAPTVEIIDFTPLGPVLAVRPHTHTDHYWQVYFATNAAITDTFGAAGYPTPEAHYHLRQS